MTIDSIAPRLDTLLPTPGLKPTAGANLAGSEAPEGASPTFGQFLQNALAEVNQAQLHAGDMTTRFAAGEPLDVHQVMIASQEASVALSMAIQVRNKLTDAYQEIMRTGV